MRATVDDETFRPGMVAVVQTAGDMANLHPHVHALVSRGGWSRDGVWINYPSRRNLEPGTDPAFYGW